MQKRSLKKPCQKAASRSILGLILASKILPKSNQNLEIPLKNLTQKKYRFLSHLRN